MPKMESQLSLSVITSMRFSFALSGSMSDYRDVSPTLVQVEKLRRLPRGTNTFGSTYNPPKDTRVQTLLQDIRYALRQLCHAPTFTLTSLFTFVFSIAATTEIFTLTQAIMLKSLPVADPAHLY